MKNIVEKYEGELKCFIELCPTNDLNDDLKSLKRFYRFPKTKRRQSLWLQRIGKSINTSIDQSSLLCSDHFNNTNSIDDHNDSNKIQRTMLLPCDVNDKDVDLNNHLPQIENNNAVINSDHTYSKTSLNSLSIDKDNTELELTEELANVTSADEYREKIENYINQELAKMPTKKRCSTSESNERNTKKCRTKSKFVDAKEENEQMTDTASEIENDDDSIIIPNVKNETEIQLWHNVITLLPNTEVEISNSTIPMNIKSEPVDNSIDEPTLTNIEPELEIVPSTPMAIKKEPVFEPDCYTNSNEIQLSSHETFSNQTASSDLVIKHVQGSYGVEEDIITKKISKKIEQKNPSNIVPKKNPPTKQKTPSTKQKTPSGIEQTPSAIQQTPQPSAARPFPVNLISVNPQMQMDNLLENRIDKALVRHLKNELLVSRSHLLQQKSLYKRARLQIKELMATNVLLSKQVNPWCKCRKSK